MQLVTGEIKTRSMLTCHSYWRLSHCSWRLFLLSIIDSRFSNIVWPKIYPYCIMDFIYKLTGTLRDRCSMRNCKYSALNYSTLVHGGSPVNIPLRLSHPHVSAQHWRESQTSASSCHVSSWKMSIHLNSTTKVTRCNWGPSSLGVDGLCNRTPILPRPC